MLKRRVSEKRRTPVEGDLNVPRQENTTRKRVDSLTSNGLKAGVENKLEKRKQAAQRDNLRQSRQQSTGAGKGTIRSIADENLTTSGT